MTNLPCVNQFLSLSRYCIELTQRNQGSNPNDKNPSLSFSKNVSITINVIVKGTSTTPCPGITQPPLNLHLKFTSGHG
jgi:hypothetical protein